MPPSAKLTQKGRPLRARVGDLGDDDLIAVSLVGDERVSQPFVFTVDFVSEQAWLKPSSVLNRPATLWIEVTNETKRVVNGIVRRFAYLGSDEELTRWRAEIVPKLWLLSLESASRIWENEKLADIVSPICRGVALELVDRVGSAPAARPYVVQYRETNLDFFQRTLEEAGLYYSFAHEAQRHKVVISDAKADSIPEGKYFKLHEHPVLEGDRPMLDVITSVSREYVVHAREVALTDHHLLRADEADRAQSAKPGAAGTRADHLGDFGLDVWTGEARRRMEIEEAGHDVIRGTSTCAALTPCTRVSIQRLGEASTMATCHLLHVRHRLAVGDVRSGTGMEAWYENEFEGIPAEVPYKPPRVTPRPCVRGTHTAMVTGQGGDGAIDVDKDGCVLLIFPWNKPGGSTKHRVHVATTWAGMEWGAIHIPRVGQEVLVEYLEGDPERPIVTGRVYTYRRKHPYELAKLKTQSGWKSRTLGGKAENFNELRFDDDKGKEHVFVQAERDLQVKVKNDETRDVLHDRITTVKNDDTRTVKEGKDTHTIEKGDQSVTVTQGSQTVTVHKDQTVKVETGNRTVTVQQGDDVLKVSAGHLKIEVSAGNVTIKAAAGKIALEAAQQIELKVGASTLTLAPAKIEMKSVQVNVEAQGTATVKSPMLTLEGTGQAQLKGSMVTVQGQGMTQVKAPVTQVSGDGMLMAKGGVTMIN